jgi:hypothetical protein
MPRYEKVGRKKNAMIVTMINDLESMEAGEIDFLNEMHLLLRDISIYRVIAE